MSAEDERKSLVAFLAVRAASKGAGSCKHSESDGGREYNAVQHTTTSLPSVNTTALTRDVLWDLVHSSHIHTSHETSRNYSHGKHQGEKSLINKYMRKPPPPSLPPTLPSSTPPPSPSLPPSLPPPSPPPSPPPLLPPTPADLV